MVRKQAYLVMILVSLFLLALSACSAGSGNKEAAGRGKSLFDQAVIGGLAGCSVCHSLDEGTVIVGPSLAGIGTIAETRIPGTSAQEYLRESIIHPDAHLVEFYPSGVMPSAYDDALNDEQIADLVAFMLTLE